MEKKWFPYKLDHQAAEGEPMMIRKSTQGGVVLIGGCCFKSWSSIQALISLSSGESQYHGVVKGSSVGLGVPAMLRDFYDLP